MKKIEEGFPKAKKSHGMVKMKNGREWVWAK